MTTDLSLSNLFEGKEVHIIEYKNDVWIPLNDLATAWGIDRTTPFKIVARNMEAFKDMISMIDGDIMSQSAGMHVNERGLYLLMGKISASRLKNKEASLAIIRFQRWVPELIQKYRKREIVQVTDHAKVLNDIRFVKELAGLVGAEPLPLYCQILEKYNLGYLGGLLVVQKDKQLKLPEPQKVKDWMTPTEIGKVIGKTAKEVNQWLWNNDYQRKDEQTDEWRLTQKGRACRGEERVEEYETGHYGIRIHWNKEILEKFNMLRHMEMG
jgi:prophage antirepressor-like protein